MCNPYDTPWRAIKEALAQQIGELTHHLWMVGPANRIKAHSKGFHDWKHPALQPSDMGYQWRNRTRILREMLEVNRSATARISLRKITTNVYGWRDTAPIEFFVDFEKQPTSLTICKTCPTRRLIRSFS